MEWEMVMKEPSSKWTYNNCASAGWLRLCLYKAVKLPIGSQSLSGMTTTLTLSHLNSTAVWVVMKSEHGGSLLVADCSSSVWSAVLLPSCFSKVLIVNTIAGSQLLCSVLGRSGKLKKKKLFTQKGQLGSSYCTIFWCKRPTQLVCDLKVKQ